MLWLTKSVDSGILVIGIDVVVGFRVGTVEGRVVEGDVCPRVELVC